MLLIHYLARLTGKAAEAQRGQQGTPVTQGEVARVEDLATRGQKLKQYPVYQSIAPPNHTVSKHPVSRSVSESPPQPEPQDGIMGNGDSWLSGS